MSARTDTPLAELLLARGLVGRPLLSEALEHVRRRRGQDERVSLALFLLERGALPPEILEDALRHVALHVSRMDDSRETAREVETLGPYRLLRKIAEGGMGAVYEAEHSETGGRYALKTIKAEAGLLDEEALARLQREARLSAALDHPRVVRVHAAEFEGPVPYLVQDLLSGGTLSERVRSGGVLAPEAGAELVAQLAEGLAVAHEAGILHRDLKPDNVLFSERGEPVLVDFGLSRRLSGNSIQLTQTGEILGTPAYMAPEQAMDVATAREAADVYALGAILYFVLEGVPPFQAQTVLETLNFVLTEPAPEAASAPPALRALLARVMSKDPAERPSARELAAELRRCVEAPAPASPLAPLLGLALAAVGLLIGALIWSRSGPDPTPTPTPSASRAPTPTPSPRRVPDPRVAGIAEEVRSGAKGSVSQSLAALELLRRAPDHPESERAASLIRELEGRALVRIPFLPEGNTREAGFLPGGRSLYGLSGEALGRLDLDVSPPAWRVRSGPNGLRLSRGRVSGRRLWVSLGMRRSWVYSLPCDELLSASLEAPALRPAPEWRERLQGTTVRGDQASLAIDQDGGYLAHGQGNRVSLHALDPPRPLGMLDLPLDIDAPAGAPPPRVFADVPSLAFAPGGRLLAVLNKRLPNPLANQHKTYPGGGVVLRLQIGAEGLRVTGGVSLSQAVTAFALHGEELFLGGNLGNLRRLEIDALPADPSVRRSATRSNGLGVPFPCPVDYEAARVAGVAVSPKGTRLFVAYRFGETGRTAELGRWTRDGEAWTYRRLAKVPLPRRLSLSAGGDLLLLQYDRDVRSERHLGEVWLVGVPGDG